MATAPLLANDKCLGHGVFLGKNRVHKGQVQPRISLRNNRCGVRCCLCNLLSAIPPTLRTTNADFLEHDGRKISARLLFDLDASGYPLLVLEPLLAWSWGCCMKVLTQTAASPKAKGWGHLEDCAQVNDGQTGQPQVKGEVPFVSLNDF